MAQTSELPLDSNILALIRTHIEAHKIRIGNEIRSYPMPIPACDAQYNFLLGERVRINQELELLRALSRDLMCSADPLGAVRAFIDASACLTDALRRELQSQLRRPAVTGGR